LCPIPSRYSSISGIANSLSRPPEALTASSVAALDCRLFSLSMALLYVLLAAMEDEEKGRWRTEMVGERYLKSTRRINEIDSSSV